MHAHLGLHEVGEHECDGAALALVAVHKSGASALARRIDERRCTVEESSDVLLLHVAHRAAQAPGYQSILSQFFVESAAEDYLTFRREQARPGLSSNHAHMTR